MTRDVGDSGDILWPLPPFFNFCCKQNHLFNSTQGRPLRGAWVTQTQSQSHSAEGRRPLVLIWLIASCQLLAAICQISFPLTPWGAAEL
jgi:hypothetical protein